MAANFRLANAPCSWGVDFADRAENPDWRTVLDQVAAAGFTSVDLGPYGYFPTDPAQLADELSARGLALSAGGLFDPLSDSAAFPEVIQKTRRTCELLSALGASRLVIIDQVSDIRGRTAGRSAVATRLAPADWKDMMRRIIQIARIAAEEHGVSSTLHAHAGCYIEFEDEIDHAMADLPEDLVGLCVDTGHAAYASSDPLSMIRRYSGRLRHMHFKNIRAEVRAKVVAHKIGFFDAIALGIFCPLGEGIVDFSAIGKALEAIDYTGIAVVEQDIDPAGSASPLRNAMASIAYLKSLGMASRARISKTERVGTAT